MQTGIRLTIAGIAAGAVLTGLATPAPAADAPAGNRGPRPTPAFSLSEVNSGRLTDLSGVPADSSDGKVMKRHGFGVLRAPSGEMAVVNRSSAREGATAAAGSSFVDLSWQGYAPKARYVISRDGKELARLDAGVVSFRDTQVQPGSVHNYRVAPLLPAGGDPEARLYGLKVTVPASGSAAGLSKAAVAQAQAAEVAPTTTLTWVAFIPQARVDAPAVGCDFGDGYEFAGDGHGFDWRASGYRAALNATIDWSDKSMTPNTDIGESVVYAKGAVTPTAVRTASDEDLEVKKLGSGSDYVDVRMVMHASNPFCEGVAGVHGAIDGALTMDLTTSGNYTIRSGSTRQAPSHYIYIYDGGQVTDVFKLESAGLACLIGSITCPEADMTGYYGTF
ncbi:hypothetical protein [Streptomyces sp. NBC_00083]|uniref:hypothetical protein n=1 Tax=Streptomyces sp. NBC_00083 TaxID=2975647 RepID=UPI00225415F3|nr:hypothetical protein [Streptomyces sp. NBC_00083]MCX5387877.1 hypothetical protein [Streptomyces sp. NBC_00083]